LVTRPDLTPVKDNLLAAASIRNFKNLSVRARILAVLLWSLWLCGRCRSTATGGFVLELRSKTLRLAEEILDGVVSGPFSKDTGYLLTVDLLGSLATVGHCKCNRASPFRQKTR
jgi:hypothetical protein